MIRPVQQWLDGRHKLDQALSTAEGAAPPAFLALQRELYRQRIDMSEPVLTVARRCCQSDPDITVSQFTRELGHDHTPLALCSASLS